MEAIVKVSQILEHPLRGATVNDPAVLQSISDCCDDGRVVRLVL